MNKFFWLVFLPAEVILAAYGDVWCEIMFLIMEAMK
jgi:hypothetical protein